MYQRHPHRRDRPDERRPEPPAPRRDVDDVLALQQAIGNQGTARVLAREKDKNRPSYEHSVKLGKLGPIEITGGNVAEWAAKKDPDGLTLITPSGKHSKELKRLFEARERIGSLETASVVGENTLVTIVFTNCRIRRYSTDEKQDEWTLELDGVKRQTLSIGTPRR